MQRVDEWRSCSHIPKYLELEARYNVGLGVFQIASDSSCIRSSLRITVASSSPPPRDRLLPADDLVPVVVELLGPLLPLDGGALQVSAPDLIATVAFA